MATKVRFGSVEVAVPPSATAGEAVELFDALRGVASRFDALSGVEARATAAEARATAAEARADAAESRATAAEARATAAESRAKGRRFDADDIALILAAARVLGPDYDGTGKTPEEIQRDTISAVFPGVSLDGKTPEALSALFEAAIATRAGGDTDSMPPPAPEKPGADAPGGTDPAQGGPAPAAPEGQNAVRADAARTLNAALGAPRMASRVEPYDYTAEAAARGRRPLNAR